ncbi:hypothetical protein [Maribacter sp. ACAM166]|uniref:hypothetical protein n=1 Tax=Maribacter sp. ACAM166 TaxID=2508996 RepID=UPI0010FD2853|nr:hypothetical protein [Maribacter sp. ACAM166]TLP82618.1 hypothetical protein ES765_00160 [Maribacter sp. ACAM166]
MKHTLLILTFLLFSISNFSQDTSHNLKPGDVLYIIKNSNTPFHHLNFPRPNFIIKRGAIANFKGLNGMRVKIEEILDGSIVKLTPLDGKKFFNKFPYVNANLEKALNSNELKLLSKNHNSFALAYEAKY